MGACGPRQLRVLAPFPTLRWHTDAEAVSGGFSLMTTAEALVGQDARLGESSSLWPFCFCTFDVKF